MKKALFIFTTFAVILFGFSNCSNNEVTLANWMKQIKGETPICKISIPATHHHQRTTERWCTRF